MKGHALVRTPKKLKIKGGRGNVVGCECGAISMAPSLAQRIAWHAEHVRSQTPVSEVTQLTRSFEELRAQVAAVAGG